MRRIWTALLLLMLCLSCSCSEKGDENRLVIATWNVQNLFDSVDDGTEYEEYSSASGWNEEGYRRRLEKAVSAISRIEDLNILVLEEVEGPRVLDDLVASGLGKRSLSHYAWAREEGGATSVAILSELPFLDVKVHGVEGQRPILEASVLANGQTIGIFAVHFKSRVEGSVETEPLRLKSMRALKAAVEAYRKVNPQSPVFLCGDFNACPRQEMEGLGIFTRRADPLWRQKQESGSLLVESAPDSLDDAWLCTWLENAQLKGSYCYQLKWLCYDCILASPAALDGAGWEARSFSVLDDPFLLNENQEPYAWRLFTRTGISDHLPVYMELEWL